MIRFIRLAAALALVPLLALAQGAQDYPSRSVTLVVPYSAGGTRSGIIAL